MLPICLTCAGTSNSTSHVTSASYDEKANRWDVRLENGQRMRAQLLIAAVGILSARYIPPFEGIDSFKGESYHTSRWLQGQGRLHRQTGGKVIGTGATAVQLILIIAGEVGHLTVFQRTPNGCAPLRNSLVSEETQRRFGKGHLPGDRCRQQQAHLLPPPGRPEKYRYRKPRRDLRNRQP